MDFFDSTLPVEKLNALLGNIDTYICQEMLNVTKKLKHLTLYGIDARFLLNFDRLDLQTIYLDHYYSIPPTIILKIVQRLRPMRNLETIELGSIEQPPVYMNSGEIMEQISAITVLGRTLSDFIHLKTFKLHSEEVLFREDNEPYNFSSTFVASAIGFDVFRDSLGYSITATRRRNWSPPVCISNSLYLLKATKNCPCYGTTIILQRKLLNK